SDSARERESDGEDTEEASETPAPAAAEEKPSFDEWGAAQVDEDVLKSASPITLVVVPGAEEETTLHTFRLRVDSEGQIFLRIRKGVRAAGEFLLGDDYTNVVLVPVPDRELEIQGEGGVL